MVLPRMVQVLIAFGLVFHLRVIHAQAGAEAQAFRTNSMVPPEQLLEDIVSTNARLRQATAVLIEGQQEQFEKSLLAILGSSIPDERKTAAAAILGQNRSYLAIPYLVNHLEWQMSLVTKPGAWTAYIGNIDYPPRTNRVYLSPRRQRINNMIRTNPVAGPLVNIGVDAIPALMDKISKSDDRPIIELCLIICREIEGGNNVAGEVTKLRLQECLKSEAEPKKKERFQTAINIFEEL